LVGIPQLREAVHFQDKVGAPGSLVLPENARLQNSICGVDFSFRSEFLKLRRWSLGLRRLTGSRTRQGEPGEEEFSDSEIE
jgi:hypothetical protein